LKRLMKQRPLGLFLATVVVSLSLCSAFAARAQAYARLSDRILSPQQEKRSFLPSAPRRNCKPAADRKPPLFPLTVSAPSGALAAAAQGLAGSRTQTVSDDFLETFSTAKREQPSIVLLAPNGGERVRTGQLVTIRWMASGLKTGPNPRKYILQFVAVTEFPYSQYVRSYVSADGSP
jgi:hypothetical protein